MCTTQGIVNMEERKLLSWRCVESKRMLICELRGSVIL